MNIYLDVDGTLLLKDFTPISNLDLFLRKVLSLGNVYWLTTHCKGERQTVIDYMKPHVSKESISLLVKVFPTNWETLKTEAIKFNEPFLWFDDYLLEAEKKVLRNRGVLDSWVEVDISVTKQLEMSRLLR